MSEQNKRNIRRTALLALGTIIGVGFGIKIVSNANKSRNQEETPNAQTTLMDPATDWLYTHKDSLHYAILDKFHALWREFEVKNQQIQAAKFPTEADRDRAYNRAMEKMFAKQDSIEAAYVRQCDSLDAIYLEKLNKTR